MALNTYSEVFALSGNNVEARIYVTENSTNVTNNTSSVSVYIQVHRTNTGYTTYGSGTVSGSVNGASYSKSISSTTKVSNSTWVTLYSNTYSITHSTDGSKTISVTTKIDWTRTGSSSLSCTLTPIPRASSISVDTLTMGTPGTITISRASSSFTHTITYTFGSYSETVCTESTETSVSWTPPLSLANAVPNATSGIGELTCDTYNGDTKVGSNSINFTANVPSSVVPTIGSFTAEKVNNTVPAAWDLYIQGKSQCKLTINNAAGAYSSTIKSYSIKQDTMTISSNSTTTTGVLNTSGSITYTATITDSRERTTTETIVINVVEYANPSITSILSQRCLSDGTLYDDGTYIKGAVKKRSEKKNYKSAEKG